MRERPVEILLVESDPELAAMMRRCLQEMIPARVTHAPTGSSAMREELTTRHDVILVSTDLPDAVWSDLVRQIRVTNRGAIFLLSDDPTVAELLDAVRLRVSDVLTKPFDLADMCAVVQEAGERALVRDRRRRRHQRLRRLTSRIIRERRDLRQRIDLICRDFVHAYRRLAERVSESDLLSQK